MSFAALEQRTNAAVMRRLSNASARVVGEFTDIPGIFDQESMLTETGATVSRSLLTVLDADVPRVTANDSQLQIGDKTFVVRDLQPDGTGLTVLVLEAC